MKHLINMVDIQEGWVGVLTQWCFITPHPQRTAPTCFVWEKPQWYHGSRPGKPPKLCWEEHSMKILCTRAAVWWNISTFILISSQSKSFHRGTSWKKGALERNWSKETVSNMRWELWFWGDFTDLVCSRKPLCNKTACMKWHKWWLRSECCLTWDVWRIELASGFERSLHHLSVSEALLLPSIFVSLCGNFGNISKV